MSWLYLSIASAVLLGFYDYLRKTALRDNAVTPVLFGSMCAAALVWLPFIVWSAIAPHTLPAPFLHVTDLSIRGHLLLVMKAVLVGASWLCGYKGLQSLPLSIATPIRATAPLWTIFFAVTVFHEAPTPRQWLGVSVILFSFFAFTLVGRREGIHFHRNRAVFFMLAATLLGAASALYDKYLMQVARLAPGTVQAWFSVYAVIVMFPALVFWLRSKNRAPFRFHWVIPAVGVTVLATDILYFMAIAQPGALISLVSPVRRTSVIVSFLIGIVLLREKQVYAKGTCIAGILLGVFLLS